MVPVREDAWFLTQGRARMGKELKVDASMAILRGAKEKSLLSRIEM